jgi:hypothetical protein
MFSPVESYMCVDWNESLRWYITSFLQTLTHNIWVEMTSFEP